MMDIQGCVQLNETFAVTRKTKVNFPSFATDFGGGGVRLGSVSSCLLAQPRWRPTYANKIYVCLLVTKHMRMFTALILFL